MRWFVFILSVLAACAPAWGEANDARRDAWRQAVDELSAVLTGKDEAVVAVALRDVSLRSFEATRIVNVADLFDQCTGGLPVTARAYIGPPKQAARDIGSDFAACDVPDAIKQKFIDPPASADRIAQRWITDTLAVDDKTYTGLIVLWRGNRALPALSDDHARHVVFVLVKATFSDDGMPHLQQVVFGNPLLRRK